MAANDSGGGVSDTLGKLTLGTQKRGADSGGSRSRSGSTDSSSGRYLAPAESKQQEERKSAAWEPVSPEPNEQRPKQRKGRSASMVTETRAVASSSGPSGSASAPSSRRGSKASELSFPVSGLDAGMQTMNQQEFIGLLKNALKLSDLPTARRLLTSALPRNIGTVQCFIRRHRGGILKHIYPSYELFLEESRDPTFLMSSKKRMKNRTSNYTISLLSRQRLEHSSSEASMTSEDPNYLGKVRSNFSGSEFVGYDAGINPKTLMDATSGSSGLGSSALGWLKGSHGGRRPSESKLSNVRQELCALIFDSNIVSRSPRRFTCVIPAMLPEDPTKRIVCRPLVPSDTLLYQYRQLLENDAEKHEVLNEDKLLDAEVMVLMNKQPVYEEKIGAYCLNFHGRALVPSVKNFQLVSARGNRRTNPVMMQFGKMDKDVFSMDVSYPLSILQAFEIALAGMDTKLVCD